MKEHNIKLTSAEIGILWDSYMAESVSLPVLMYFNHTVEDLEIKDVIEFAIKKVTEHLTTLTQVFTNEDYPIPVGFSEEDVNVTAPRVYSDSFMLYFVRNLGKAGLASNGLALSMAARKDIRDLYFHYLNEAAEIEDLAKEVALSKGLYIRPPYISPPKQTDFVEQQSFLRGWLGERRTLTGTEIAHLFHNFQNNAYGKALLIGFSQTTKSDELRSYYIRGIELARSVMETYRTLLEESTLPSPMTWDTEVSDSTIAPFSEKLMLYHASKLNAVGMGNIGGSLALSMRHDISAKYLKQLKDIGLYAQDGFNLLIKHSWFERPPQAIDREHVAKGRNE